MTQRRSHNVLRVSTFVAVSMGLAFGAATALATPPNTGDAPLAQTGDQMEEAETPHDQPTVDQQEVDYPAAIEDFNEFVEEHRQEGIDDVHSYIHEGAEHMADAMREVLPQEDQLFEEEPEQFQALEDQLDAFEERVDELSDEEREDFAQVTHDVFTDGADWLHEVEQHVTADVSASIDQLRTTADEIDPAMDIEQQSDTAQNYYTHAVTATQQLYTALEEQEPVTMHPITAESPLFAGEPRLAQNDGLFDDEEVDVPAAVEDFNEFVEEHRQEGIDHVADYTREGSQHYHDALEEFIEDDQELLVQRLDEFDDMVDELDDTPRAEYPQTLVDTLNEGTEILMIVQQANYPQQETQVAETFDAIEQIDTNVAIEQQVATIENAFAHAAATLESMGRAEEPPAAGADDDVVLAGETAQQPGMEEPSQDEPMHDEPMHDEPMHDDPMMEQEAELGEEIQQFNDTVDQMSPEQLTGEEGERMVVDAMRDLEGAVATFVDEEPAMQEDPAEPGARIERAEYDDRGERADEQHDEMADKHQELTDAIDEMEQNVGEEQYGQYMVDAMEASTELLESLQQEQFPGLEGDIQRIRQATDQLDAEAELDEQANEVIEYFEANRDALEAMDTEEPAPVTLIVK